MSVKKIIALREGEGKGIYRAKAGRAKTVDEEKKLKLKEINI